MTGEVKDLTREDYELIRKLVYAKSGINLGPNKMQLVRARLGKRIRNSNLNSFREYYHVVEQDASGEKLCELLDAISTNTTHLFREKRHFELLDSFIRQRVEDRAWRAHHSTFTIWSAACSSGEEPHSIAMVVHNALRNQRGVTAKILATDLSTQMLSRAKQGIYESHRVGTVPPDLRSKYFQKVKQGNQVVLQLASELRQMITFARFNLMTPTFPFRQGFDVIFCRNVMIYFDRETQETLVNKQAGHLRSGGMLLIGHSESLNGINHPLSYVEPTVYRKG